MKKTGKQITIENENFKIKKYTLDSNTTNSISIDFYSWIIPNYEIEDLQFLKKLQFKIKLYLFENINYQIFKKSFIVDLDIRLRNINIPNKKTYYNLNITLHPIKQNWKDINFQFEIDNLILKLQNFILNNQPFTFTTNK
jgi:hypothetical protein